MRADPNRRRLAALGAIVLVAALLRFWRIGHQSFELDEVTTAFGMHLHAGDLLSWIAGQEATPPLYYLAAWLWAHIFGYGEAALRSLSALAGTLTVPLVYLAGRRLFSPRVGLLSALLVAVNPYLIWYSQEARSYSLAVALAALGLAAWARALEEPTRRSLALWALAAVLAMATHYFTAFLIVPEAAWLLWRLRDARAVAAVAAAAAAGLALVPLALHQRSNHGVDYIAALPLRGRLTPIAWKAFGSEHKTTVAGIVGAAQVVAFAAVAWALARLEPARRRNELVLLGLVAVTAALPVALALGGLDYVVPRNLIVLLIPLLVAVAAGLGAAGRVGVAGAAALAAAGTLVTLQVAYTRELQRDDWRGAARALGRAGEPRAVVVSPWFNDRPLALYAGPLPPFPGSGAAVREVDVVLTARDGRPPALLPPPGFRPAGEVRTPSHVLVRYRAPRPVSLTPAQAGAASPGPQPYALIQNPTEENIR